MPRYVILEHTGSDTYKPGQHWDLMLELGPSLRCWELAAPPVAGKLQTAIKLPDHRIAFLDYEGPISDDRGSVTRWDVGEYELVSESLNKLIASLSGGSISGTFQLSREPQDDKRWTFSLIQARSASE